VVDKDLLRRNTEATKENTKAAQMCRYSRVQRRKFLCFEGRLERKMYRGSRVRRRKFLRSTAVMITINQCNIFENNKKNVLGEDKNKYSKIVLDF
jgi:hypothetical protein